jgi:predicted ATPase
MASGVNLQECAKSFRNAKSDRSWSRTRRRPADDENLSLEHFVVISGCSGGGKSTLLMELARRGHAVVGEPGRRIVKEQLKGDGSALPWLDGGTFARRAVEQSLADRAAAGRQGGWVFFDRGLIDAAPLPFST